jgi:hypothetical protein
MSLSSARHFLPPAACTAIIAAFLTIAAAAQCADFRLENKVYSENQKDATSRSTTIFNEGMVYDFMQDPEETIIFDKAGGKFTMLDMKRKIKTELTTKDISDFSQKLKKWAAEQSDPQVKFMGAPKFEEKFDATARKMTLSSPSMTYQVATGPADDKSDIPRQYGDFSAWLAQLNAMLTPGGRLPFPRVELALAMANRGLTPREVVLTIKTGSGTSAKETTARSEHQLGTALSASDLARVKSSQQAAGSFKPVTFDEYRKR